MTNVTFNVTIITTYFLTVAYIIATEIVPIALRNLPLLFRDNFACFATIN